MIIKQDIKVRVSCIFLKLEIT